MFYQVGAIEQWSSPAPLANPLTVRDGRSRFGMALGRRIEQVKLKRFDQWGERANDHKLSDRKCGIGCGNTGALL